MMYWVVFLMAVVATGHARTFNNPILGDKEYSSPSVFKDNDTYYVVATIADQTNEMYQIHSSTDLIEWKPAGFIFNNNTKPMWASHYFFHPKIHKIGGFFMLYFSAANFTSGFNHVAAAIAPHPLGPYSSIDRPIFTLSEESYYPTVINDQERLYLVWTNVTSSPYINYARQLNSDGLTFSSDQTTILLKTNSTWDVNSYSLWYMRRESYHYLFYSGPCAVGVARSSHALGPYEKLADPIISANKDYGCPHDPSTAKDLDEQSDLIFFNAYRMDDPAKVRSVVVASLSWDAEDWPYVGDF